MDYDKKTVEQLDVLLQKNMEKRAALRVEAILITAARDKKTLAEQATGQAISGAGAIKSEESVKGF